MTAEFIGNVGHQLCVNPVIQKAVHLDDVAGQHSPLGHDAVFQFLHTRVPLSSIYKVLGSGPGFMNCGV